MIRMNDHHSRHSLRATLFAAGMVLTLGFPAEARAEFAGTGLYTVTASVSGKVFDIDSTWWGGHLAGRELLQWGSHGRSNQQFYFKEVSPGVFEIRAGGELSNMCLDVPSSSLADGTIIQQWPCNRGDNQHFRVIRVGPNLYQIQATHTPTTSGLFVGDPSRNNSLDDGARITLKRLDGICPSARMLFSFTSL